MFEDFLEKPLFEDFLLKGLEIKYDIFTGTDISLILFRSNASKGLLSFSFFQIGHLSFKSLKLVLLVSESFQSRTVCLSPFKTR